ncbi:MAG: RluA family pseudouridine synthase [Sandaracinaceae bacterium]
MIPVVHEDEHLLVVNKPTGLPTTSPREGDSLTQRLMSAREEKLHPSSRLDAEVTGMVTFARTKPAIRALEQARKEGRYTRTYVALSAGALSDHGRWDASIAIAPHDRRLRAAVPPGTRGARVQHAETAFQVSARTAHVALLRLSPQTGRTHQLRVHAANAGAPLLGDHRYGGPKRVTLPDGRVLSVRRTMLHCAVLGLPRVGGGRLDLRLAPPEDFALLFEALGGDTKELEPSCWR